MAQSQNIQEEEGVQERRILDALVAQSNFSPTQAVQQLLEITSARSNASGKQLGNHCYYTACALLDVAANTAPAQQPKLVSFFNQLRSTSVAASSGEKLKYNDDAVWEDLPTFGYTIADKLSSFMGFQEYTPQESRQWENTIAFFAQLDASISASEIDLDFTRTWALTFFTIAFDVGNETGATELAVRLASNWFIHDAAKIWRNVPQTAEGFSFEAWQRWKAGLRDAKLVAESEATKTLIAEALVQMEKVEN